MAITPLFTPHENGSRARTLLFMSGSGTNAEALLSFCRHEKKAAFEPVGIVTDAPETSRARELGNRFSLPVLELDIRHFYRERGEEGIALTTPRRRALREEWTEALRALVAPFRPDFILLAGFVPLSNITRDYPCLNVHPGNLTVEENGRRVYAGLHFRPVEEAILRGETTLRSSVILAQPYDGCGDAEMDSGPVLGISEPVPIELGGCTLSELRAVEAARPPRGPYRDLLRKIATLNLEHLKVAGDHIVFPAAVNDFAAGCFALGGDTLHYCGQPVKTVEYGFMGHTPLPQTGV